MAPDAKAGLTPRAAAGTKNRFQPIRPLSHRGERNPEELKLRPIPARTNAQAEPPGTERMETLGHLYGDQRKTICSARHQRLEDHSLGRLGQRGQSGLGLQDRTVIEGRGGLEVVEHPDPMEAEAFGLPGPLPGYWPALRSPGLCQLALPALGEHHTPSG